MAKLPLAKLTELSHHLYKAALHTPFLSSFSLVHPRTTSAHDPAPVTLLHFSQLTFVELILKLIPTLSQRNTNTIWRPGSDI
jgi:hypothetical protein